MNNTDTNCSESGNEAARLFSFSFAWWGNTHFVDLSWLFVFLHRSISFAYRCTFTFYQTSMNISNQLFARGWLSIFLHKLEVESEYIRHLNGCQWVFLMIFLFNRLETSTSGGESSKQTQGSESCRYYIWNYLRFKCKFLRKH